MSPDDPQFTIKAAHVPIYDGESIANPTRALAKIEVRFPELEEPHGRTFEGVVILFAREDGNVLNKVQGFPVTLDGIYLDDGTQISSEALSVLNDAGQRALAGIDLRGIWQDSRMYALYHAAHAAAQKAVAAYNKQVESADLYFKHISKYYTEDADGELGAHVDGVDYLTLDADGNIVDD